MGIMGSCCVERLKTFSTQPALGQPPLQGSSLFVFSLQCRPTSNRPWARAIAEWPTQALSNHISQEVIPSTGLMLLFLPIRQSCIEKIMRRVKCTLMLFSSPFSITFHKYCWLHNNLACFIFFKLFIIFILCASFCLHMYIACMPAAYGSQKRTPELLESGGCMSPSWRWEMNSGFSGRITSTRTTEKSLHTTAYLLFKTQRGHKVKQYLGFKYLLE